MAAVQGIPPVPYQTPIVSGKDKLVSYQWANWFRSLLTNVQGTALTNPMSAIGDMIFGANLGSPSRLPGNTSSTKQFLTQTGNNSQSAQPTWGAIGVNDVPILNQNTTGSAGSLTQSLTQFQLLIGEGASAGVGSLGSIGTAGQALVSQGPGLVPVWATVGGLTVFGTRAAPVAITATGGITPNAVQRQLIRISGSGGVTITAGTPIAAGSVDGQELILEGCSASNTVTINSGTGLEFGGTMELGTGDKIAFLWNASASVWTEQYRFFAGITGGVLTDASGNPLTDASGNPLTE